MEASSAGSTPSPQRSATVSRRHVLSGSSQSLAGLAVAGLAVASLAVAGLAVAGLAVAGLAVRASCRRSRRRSPRRSPRLAVRVGVAGRPGLLRAADAAEGARRRALARRREARLEGARRARHRTARGRFGADSGVAVDGLLRLGQHLADVGRERARASSGERLATGEGALAHHLQ